MNLTLLLRNWNSKPFGVVHSNIQPNSNSFSKSNKVIVCSQGVDGLSGECFYQRQLTSQCGTKESPALKEHSTLLRGMQRYNEKK